MVYNLSIVIIVKGYQMHLFILFFFKFILLFAKIIGIGKLFCAGFLCVPKFFGTKTAGFHFFLFTYNLPH